MDENKLKVRVEGTRVVGTSYSMGEPEEGWVLVEDESLVTAFYDDPFHWLYIDGQFIKEDPEDIRRREEEERRRAERNAPVLLQTQYITREEFNLLPYQDTNTLYYILEDDGTATMQKGVN